VIGTQGASFSSARDLNVTVEYQLSVFENALGVEGLHFILFS
jgi:hypothetical protein